MKTIMYYFEPGNSLHNQCLEDRKRICQEVTGSGSRSIGLLNKQKENNSFPVKIRPAF